MSRADFDAAIARMAAQPDREAQEVVRTEIWERWGRTGAVFITDMANFSQTARLRGITWFLAMIQRARSILDPIVARHGGVVLKHETDNCFAFFPKAADAIRAALEVTQALVRDNVGRPLEDHIALGIGIDWGHLLLIGDEDFYGDPVNTGSKLGEDLADYREIFVTERALDASGLTFEGLVHRSRRISDIDIAYVEIPVDTSD